MIDARDYIGREYGGDHVCLQCVQAIYVYHHGYPAGRPVEEFYAHIQAHTREVSEAQPGDLAVFFHSQWHIGYVIEFRRFIHCYGGGQTLVSDLDRPLYRHTLQGFFRDNA